MTALAASKQSSFERWGQKQFTLLSGQKAWKNGIACIRLGTGKLIAGAQESDLMNIGKFAEDMDASLSDKLVNVDLSEVMIDWLANDGTHPVAATDLGALCYLVDDQTVAIAPGGGSVAGRVWGVDTIKGVAVQRVSASAPGAGVQLKGTLAAFASNNINAPSTQGIYDVPTTAAASTITLPAAAVEGSLLYFVADGTKNGHTVQYRDATGTVLLTTALTASKRHLVIAAYLNGIWNANAYVSP